MRSTHLRHSAHEISPLLRLSSISLACELSKPPSSLASLRGCLRFELDACFATSGGMGAESKGGCYRKGGAVSGQGRTSRLWLILVVSVRAVLVYQLCTDLLAMGQSRGERGSDTCSDLSLTPPLLHPAHRDAAVGPDPQKIKYVRFMLCLARYNSRLCLTTFLTDRRHCCGGGNSQRPPRPFYCSAQSLFASILSFKVLQTSTTPELSSNSKATARRQPPPR